jgi:hypothetical protein
MTIQQLNAGVKPPRQAIAIVIAQMGRHNLELHVLFVRGHSGLEAQVGANTAVA